MTGASSASTAAPAGGLHGRLRVPGDKSISHRAAAAGRPGRGPSRSAGLSDGGDVAHTAAAVAAFGAGVDGRPAPATVVVDGGADRLHEPEARHRRRQLRDRHPPAGRLGRRPAWLTVLQATSPSPAGPWTGSPSRCGPWGPQSTAATAAATRRWSSGAAACTASTTPAGAERPGQGGGPAGRPGRRAATTTVRESVPTRAHTEELLALCGADVLGATGGGDGAALGAAALHARRARRSVPGRLLGRGRLHRARAATWSSSTSTSGPAGPASSTCCSRMGARHHTGALRRGHPHRRHPGPLPARCGPPTVGGRRSPASSTRSRCWPWPPPPPRGPRPSPTPAELRVKETRPDRHRHLRADGHRRAGRSRSPTGWSSTGEAGQPLAGGQRATRTATTASPWPWPWPAWWPASPSS